MILFSNFFHSLMPQPLRNLVMAVAVVTLRSLRSQNYLIHAQSSCCLAVDVGAVMARVLQHRVNNGFGLRTKREAPRNQNRQVRSWRWRSSGKQPYKSVL